MKQPIDSLLKQYASQKNIEVSKDISKLILKTLYAEKSEKTSPNFSTLLVRVASFITIFFFLTSEVIFAEEIKTFLGNAFSLETINYHQFSIQQAINQGYLQTPESDAVVGDHYAIKVNYLLVDAINLLINFEVKTDPTIEEKDAFRLINLKIENEKGEVLYDILQSPENASSEITWSNRNIEDHILEGSIIITSNALPNSSTLSISFEKLMLYNYLTTNTPELTILPGVSNLSIKLDSAMLRKMDKKEITLQENVDNAKNIKLNHFSLYPTGIGFELTLPKQDYFNVTLLDGKNQPYDIKSNVIYPIRKTDSEMTYFVWMDFPTLENAESFSLIIQTFNLSDSSTIIQTNSYLLSY